MAHTKQRLDTLLVDKQYVESIEKARRLIMAGKVRVDNQLHDKPSVLISLSQVISIAVPDPYVSRGGIKLKGALDYFQMHIHDTCCMDIGASTGGFTDCLLQHGARRVYAVDVGTHQLAEKLRHDPRVVIVDKCNARYITKQQILDVIDVCTIDVSFISLDKIVPAVKKIISDAGYILALIKPQFEVCPQKVKKGGVVKSEEDRQEAIAKIKTLFLLEQMVVIDVVQSRLKGPAGNIEYFILGRKG